MFIKKSRYEKMQRKLNQYAKQVFDINVEQARKKDNEQRYSRYRVSSLGISPKEKVSEIVNAKIQSEIDNDLFKGKTKFYGSHKKFILGNEQLFTELGYEVIDVDELNGTTYAVLR